MSLATCSAVLPYGQNVAHLEIHGQKAPIFLRNYKGHRKILIIIIIIIIISHRTMNIIKKTKNNKGF